MDSCSSTCTVPIMRATRADITFNNDIYGFGGTSASVVAQDNLWSFRSDGSWQSIVPDSSASHMRTSWPQLVLKVSAATERWDGDTLISVSSNDDPQYSGGSAGAIAVFVYSTSRRVWTKLPNSAVG
jgi:hypothetical protein